MIRQKETILACGSGQKKCCIDSNDIIFSSIQDGTFAFADFVTAFEEYEVQRVVRSYENSISIHVNCCQQGDWSQVNLNIHFKRTPSQYMLTACCQQGDWSQVNLKGVCHKIFDLQFFS